MHCIFSDDSKESNTAKGINTATEFNEFKETLFNKKVVISSIVNEVINFNSFKKHFCNTKTCHKQKPANKNKNKQTLNKRSNNF